MFSIETLRHEELAGALLDSKVDIGLAFNPDNLPGICGELLGYGGFVVLAPPGENLPRSGALRLEDLAGRPFIKLDNQGPLDRLLAAHIESSDVELESVAIAGSYPLAKALVSHGVGVAIADEVTARSAGHKKLIIRQLEPALNFRISALYVDQETMSLGCRGFVDHLRTSLQEFLHAENESGMESTAM
jgi:DNA-binding transcriptional LysR family regulator